MKSSPAPQNQHLDEERLMALALAIEGETSEDRAHLDACAACRHNLREEQELSAAIGMVPSIAPPADFVRQTTLRFQTAKQQVSVRSLWVAALVTVFTGTFWGLSLLWKALPQVGELATTGAEALTHAVTFVNAVSVLTSVFPVLATTIVVGCLLSIAVSASVLSRLARATAK